LSALHAQWRSDQDRSLWVRVATQPVSEKFERYLVTSDRTVSIGSSMTRSPSGERTKPWR
jgi:hypothetical protein